MEHKCDQRVKYIFRLSKSISVFKINLVERNANDIPCPTKQSNLSLKEASLFQRALKSLSKASNTFCKVTSSTKTSFPLDLEPEPIDTCLLLTPKTFKDAKRNYKISI